MTKNASEVFVRHFIDKLPELNLVKMVCCVVLSVSILLILLIFIAFIIYVVSQRGKEKKPPSIGSRDFETLMNGSRAVSNSYHREISPRRSAGIPNSVLEGSLETNGQQIPLSTFKTEVGGSGADSSASSAGLCDVLFPPKHEGEVISEPPPKLVTFGGRVYASPNSASPAVSNPEPGESGLANTTRRSNKVNASLEWDYYESKRYGASNTSNASESDHKKTVDICWV